MKELPAHLEPMLLQAGTTLPEPAEDWALEVKYDGFRAVVFCSEAGVRIQSRSLRCMTAFYPELQALAAHLGQRRLVLDGELVAFDSEGRQSFEMLQHRAGMIPDTAFRRRPKVEVPVSYQIFDLLYLDGESIMEWPYQERRGALEALGLQGSHWMTPSHHLGGGASELLGATRAAGLEGLVAKRLNSVYQPGRRGPDWLKFKNWCRQEFVVGGWREDPEGGGGWLGSLLLGCHEGDQLRYVGGVELGFTDDSLEILRELLPQLASSRSPFVERQPKRLPHFLEPLLVVEIQFLGWTREGAVRQAVFRGFVLDRDPSNVRRELEIGDPWG